MLIEGGVGSAILFRLYKPIKEKDNAKISSIMSASCFLFRIIGTLIIIAGVVISFFVQFFVKDTGDMTKGYMQTVFIIYLLSQAIFYYTIPYRTMFEAEQKRFIPNIIFQTTTIIKTILELIIVNLGKGLIEILISLTICTLISNFVIWLAFKKEYKGKINLKAKKDFSMLKDVKDLFVNTIGNLLTNNIDILIISKIIGLDCVVIYTTYNYFVEAIKQFVTKIEGATMSGVGDLILEGKEKALKVFNEFNELVTFIATILCVPLFIIINQFIDIWYEGAVETKLIWAILFTAILYYQIIRMPLKVYTLSSGQFKFVKKFVIIEILINVTLSLVLAKFMGIAGVLLATIISLICADYLTKPIVIFNKILESNCVKYYSKSIMNVIFIAVSLFAYYIIFPKMYSNIFSCILFGVIVAIVNAIITIAYFYITHQTNFFERIPIINRFVKKEES